MKKLIAIGIISLFLVLGLSGCTNQNQDTNNKQPPLDIDGDGYPDDEDDFPNDSDFHELEYIIGGEDDFWIFELDSGQGKGGNQSITSDWKYVRLYWELEQPHDLTYGEQEDITFKIINPNNEVEYLYSDSSHRNFTIYIDSTNWGQWTFLYNNRLGAYDSKYDEKVISLKVKVYMVR